VITDLSLRTRGSGLDSCATAGSTPPCCVASVPPSTTHCDAGRRPAESPEELPKLLAALTSEVDVVTRPQYEVHGFWRDLASQVTKVVLQGAWGPRLRAR